MENEILKVRRVIRKNPSNGQLLITIPKTSDVEPGDMVELGKIIRKKEIEKEKETNIE